MTQPLSFTIHGNDQLSQILEKLDRNSEKVSRALDRLAKDAKQTGRAFGDAEDDARRFGDQLDETSREISQQEDRMDGLIERVKGYGIAVVAALAVASTAVTAFGTAIGVEKSKVDALLGGQLGVSKEEAKRLGTVTGEIYARGFTDSLDEAANAVRATLQQRVIDPAASTAEIEQMATRTAALAKMMQDDVDRVAAAVSTMLRTGIADSATEAFDLLTLATQQGINKSQDLLDTMIEYSVQFQALGIDAPKALGMMAQALDAGARNADVAADAIKEFAIRSKDGTDKSRKAFQDLGFDANAMFRIFAMGGPAADKAMKEVIARIAKMEDPVRRGTVLTDLFGTKADDLQGALSAIDPTTAVAAFGSATAASDKFIKSQESAGSRAEEIWRDAKNTVADVFEPALESVLDKLDEWKADPEVKEWLDDLGADMKEIGERWLPVMTETFGDFLDAIKNNKEEITLVLTGIANSVGAITSGFFWLAAGATEAFGMVVNAAQWMVNQALGTIELFISSAAKAFGWIPEIGPKLRDAEKDFAEFRRKVNEELGMIRDVDVGVKVGSGVMSAALQIGKRAAGGPVWPGEVYEWQEQGRTFMTSGASGGHIRSAHDIRSAGGGGGSDVIGTLRVVYETPDGEVIRESLLELKRNRGFRTLGFEAVTS